jgi:hypothetical protein
VCTAIQQVLTAFRTANGDYRVENHFWFVIARGR